jgi:hypothetical protein
VAGQFPLLDALIQPPASVARARVYFRSAIGPEYYFIEMTLQDGVFVGKLPKPVMEVKGQPTSPITYYIEATTTDFATTQTPEIQAVVVSDESECPEGVKAAPFGPPGPVTVFSASTAAVAVPAGFVTAGAVLGTGAILAGLIALALGTTIAVTSGDGSPSPSPTPAPTPTPTPVPTPTPTPVPTPTPILCNGVCNDVNIDGIPENCPCLPIPPAASCGGPGFPPCDYVFRRCETIGRPSCPGT